MSPEGPRPGGRTAVHAGRWRPKGESPPCSAQPCRPWRGAAWRARKQVTGARSSDAPEAPSLKHRASPPLPPPAPSGAGCPHRAAGQSSAPDRESGRPTQGQAGPGFSRQRWGRGRSGFGASLTDRLAQAHPAPRRGPGSQRARLGAGTGHP